MACCCSQQSWEKATDHPGSDTHCPSGQPVPSPPLTEYLCVDYSLAHVKTVMFGCLLQVSCPTPKARKLINCSSRDKSICMLCSVCNGNDTWEPLQKIWTTQKRRGVQKEKEVAQAVLRKDVLVALEPRHTLLLLLCQHSLYSPSTTLRVLWAGSAPECKSQPELH